MIDLITGFGSLPNRRIARFLADVFLGLIIVFVICFSALEIGSRVPRENGHCKEHFQMKIANNYSEMAPADIVGYDLCRFGYDYNNTKVDIVDAFARFVLTINFVAIEQIKYAFKNYYVCQMLQSMTNMALMYFVVFVRFMWLSALPCVWSGIMLTFNAMVHEPITFCLVSLTIATLVFGIDYIVKQYLWSKSNDWRIREVPVNVTNVEQVNGVVHYDLTSRYVFVPGLNLRVNIGNISELTPGLDINSTPVKKEAALVTSKIEPAGHRSFLVAIEALAADGSSHHFGMGSRVKFRGKDVLLTAAHVLENLALTADTILLVNHKRVSIQLKLSDIKVEAFSSCDWIAISIDQRFWSRLGVTQATIAYPMDGTGCATYGYFNGAQCASFGTLRRDSYPFVSHSCSTLVGWSGTPVLNMRGQIMAIHVESKDSKTNRAVTLPISKESEWKHEDYELQQYDVTDLEDAGVEYYDGEYRSVKVKGKRGVRIDYFKDYAYAHDKSNPNYSNIAAHDNIDIGRLKTNGPMSWGEYMDMRDELHYDKYEEQAHFKESPLACVKCGVVLVSNKCPKHGIPSLAMQAATNVASQVYVKSVQGKDVEAKRLDDLNRKFAANAEFTKTNWGDKDDFHDAINAAGVAQIEGIPRFNKHSNPHVRHTGPNTPGNLVGLPKVRFQTDSHRQPFEASKYAMNNGLCPEDLFNPDNSIATVHYEAVSNDPLVVGKRMKDQYAYLKNSPKVGEKSTEEAARAQKVATRRPEAPELDPRFRKESPMLIEIDIEGMPTLKIPTDSELLVPNVPDTVPWVANLWAVNPEWTVLINRDLASTCAQRVYLMNAIVCRWISLQPIGTSIQQLEGFHRELAQHIINAMNAAGHKTCLKGLSPSATAGLTLADKWSSEIDSISSLSTWEEGKLTEFSKNVENLTLDSKQGKLKKKRKRGNKSKKSSPLTQPSTLGPIETPQPNLSH